MTILREKVNPQFLAMMIAGGHIPTSAICGERPTTFVHHPFNTARHEALSNLPEEARPGRAFRDMDAKHASLEDGMK